jgi:hypothetical protein
MTDMAAWKKFYLTSLRKPTWESATPLSVEFGYSKDFVQSVLAHRVALIHCIAKQFRNRNIATCCEIKPDYGGGMAGMCKELGTGT